MPSNKKYLFVSIIIQSLLLYWVFQEIILGGEAVLLSNHQNGLKNYFTYHTYLLQANGTNPFLHRAMNYPFGDYIFYTGNMPLFSFVIRWFSNNIMDITPYSFGLFNLMVCSGFLFTTYLVFKTLNYLLHHVGLMVLFSVLLPWLAPQVFQLEIGHFDLSFSWIILLGIYGVVKWHKTGQRYILKPKDNLIWLYLLMVLAAFLHLSYLPILATLIGSFALFWAISLFNRKLRFWVLITTGLLLPIASIFSVWGILQAVDTYYPQRSKIVTNYNSEAWTLPFEALFTSYDFNTLPFPYPLSLNPSPATYGFLGNFGLYAVILCGFLFLFRASKKQLLHEYLGSSRGSLALLLLFSGTICLMIAIGETPHLFNETLQIVNILNPFLYLRFLTDEVTHFRSLGRFGWVFFWTFNFFILYLIDTYLSRHSQWWVKGLVGLLCCLAVVDVIDSLEYHQSKEKKNILAQTDDSIQQLLDTLNGQRYQAILPIPFYITGSEIKAYSIHGVNEWQTHTFQLALATGLPLMSCNLSRSPIAQHRALLSIFSHKGIEETLLKKLTNQPILVFYSDAVTDWKPQQSRMGQRYLEYGRLLPQKYKMKPIHTVGAWTLYEWYPK